MDASAYLKRHGWRGTGFSLDKTDRGIRKPLPLNKKIDVLGIGVNKHAAVSDQWWMRAFDDGLKNLGTTNQTVLKSVKQHGISTGGLYGRFVQGQTISGTIEDEIAQNTANSSEQSNTTSPDDSAPDLGDSKSSRSSVSADKMAESKKAKKEAQTASKITKPAEAKPVVGAKRKREENADITLEKRVKKNKSDESSISDKLEEKAARKALKRNVAAFINEAVDDGMLLKKARVIKYEKRDRASKLFGAEAVQQVFLAAGLTKEKTEPKGDKATRNADNDARKRALKKAAKQFLKDATPGESTDKDEQNGTDIAIPKESDPVPQNDTTQKKKRGRKPKSAEETTATTKAIAKSASTDADTSQIPAKTLEVYKKRAAKHGVTLETYIEKREKNAPAREAKKAAEEAQPAASFAIHPSRLRQITGGT